MNDEDEPDDYEGERAIGIKGLTQMLGISPDKAYLLGNDPLFPSFKVGHRHRFWPSEVKEYLSRPKDPWKQSARSLGRKRVGR